MAPRPDLTMSPDQVKALLAEPLIGVLTTLDREGWPHSAGMWFFLEDDELKMWTYAKSQKAVNARRDPRGSLLVESGRPYMDLRGVLVRGPMRAVTDVDEIAAIGSRLYDRYVAPTTGLRSDEGPQVEIQRQATKRVGLVLPLEKVTSWDHARALS